MLQKLRNFLKWALWMRPQDPKCWEMPIKLFLFLRKNFDNSIASNSIYPNVVADRLSVNFATSKVCPKRIWIVTKLQVIAVSCRFDVTNATPNLREIRLCKNIWSTNMKKKSIVHPFNVTGNTKYQGQSSSLVAYRLVVSIGIFLSLSFCLFSYSRVC